MRNNSNNIDKKKIKKMQVAAILVRGEISWNP